MMNQLDRIDYIPWHIWNSAPFGKTGGKIPLGESGLVEQRAQRMDIKTGGERNLRAELSEQAKPPVGVDALNGKFPGPDTPLPGVVDKTAQSK